LLVLLAFTFGSRAQELNCIVTVLHDKITGTGIDPAVFSTMQKSIADFMNSHKWTTDEYAASEKIDCNILINLTANNVNSDPDSYNATLSIQATRPVYNSTYTSKLIDFIDKDFSFKFSPFTPMHFDDNQASGSDPMSGNLTAILAYYSYIVLALDYDSFAPNGGSPYLKKAQNVVNNAPDGRGITGWKNVESTHNRYWIVDQMLNTRFSDVRKVWYSMHREGLDSMYAKPVEARGRILSNIRKLYEVNRENPSSVYIQFFFNAKSDEIIHMLAQAPKPERAQYITLLDALDVPNAPKYNALR
jgi:hypothetical protein